MSPEKMCRRCKVVKDANAYRRDARYKDGIGSWCLQCHRERNSEWALENRVRLSEKAIQWRMENRTKARAANVKHKRANAEKLAKAHAAWAEANRDKRRETDAKYKAAKLQATPAWADKKAMRAVYRMALEAEKATGERMHVDHIVPLQSAIVCGLHCEANLQILSGPLNEAKRNRWWPDMPSIEAEVNAPRLDLGEPAPRPEQVSIFAEGAA